MKKYFIADVLTMGKVIPAVLLFLCAIFDWSATIAFGLFAFGELLDAFDGMAARHWPHPKSTDKLWFRKHIKLLESGLDMLLGIGALCFTIFRVDRLFGVSVLALALSIGTVIELVLYGKLFGSKKDCKPGSLMNVNPEEAKLVVGVRFFVYLAAVAGVLLRLLIAAFCESLVVLFVILGLSIMISFIIAFKKFEEGRLDDITKVVKKIWKK